MAIGLLGLAAGGAALGLGGSMISDRWSKDKYRSPDQMQDASIYAPSKTQALQELLRRHNAGQIDLPDEQVKQLAQMAADTGMKFNPESKPLSKFMFDFADTALFGLLPNEWRPASIGQELHGESFADRTAGSIGSLGGGFASGAAVLKGGKMALGGIKGWMGKGTAAQNAARANSNASFFTDTGNVGLLGMPNIATGFQKYNPFRANVQYTEGLYPAGGGWTGPNNSFVMF
tara:strand:+ start:341 stop:1036 length:696 start_codon:yes stop_codon:yes gene_type:complete